MSKLNNVIAAAVDEVEGLPRLRSAGKSYMSGLMDGCRRWSGADIQGKAKEYGGHYARQRKRAQNILYAGGGEIIEVDHGLLVTAVPAGMDDYGNQIFDTTDGIAVARESRWSKIL